MSSRDLSADIEATRAAAERAYTPTQREALLERLAALYGEEAAQERAASRPTWETPPADVLAQQYGADIDATVLPSLDAITQRVGDARVVGELTSAMRTARESTLTEDEERAELARRWGSSYDEHLYVAQRSLGLIRRTINATVKDHGARLRMLDDLEDASGTADFADWLRSHSHALHRAVPEDVVAALFNEGGR